MKPANLEQEIRSLIAEIVEIDVDKITPDANLVEDLGMDSMMALEILASVEKKYKIKIDEEYLTKLTSLRQIVEVAKTILGKNK
jgi:acyl carrier protein